MAEKEKTLLNIKVYTGQPNSMFEKREFEGRFLGLANTKMTRLLFNKADVVRKIATSETEDFGKVLLNKNLVGHRIVIALKRIDDTEIFGNSRLFMTDAIDIVSHINYLKTETTIYRRRSERGAHIPIIIKDKVRMTMTGENSTKFIITEFSNG